MLFDRLTFNSKVREPGDPIYINSLDFIEAIYSEYSEQAIKFEISYDYSRKDPLNDFDMYIDLIWAAYINKTTMLLSSIISSANSENYICFALAGRSLIENTAILRYYMRTFIQPVVKQSVLAKNIKGEQLVQLIIKLDQLLRGARFKWDSFMAGKMEDIVKGDIFHTPQQRVGNCIKAWKKDDQSIGALYDLYCDMVHPNLGSNLLILRIWEGKTGFGGQTGYFYGSKLLPTLVVGISPVINELKTLLNTLLSLHRKSNAM